MWFASEMSKSSAKSKKSNVISPLSWPVYVMMGIGIIFFTFGVQLYPLLFGVILLTIGIAVLLIGVGLGLFLYYRQYYIAYNQDKSLLNSEGTNTERELIRYMGQRGIPLNDYNIKLPESEFWVESSKNK